MDGKLVQILLCDDDPLFQLAVKHALKDPYRVLTARNTDEAKVILRSQSIDLLLLDIQMRTENEGLDALPEIRQLQSDLPIVMISGRQDFEAIRSAMRLGARDYVPKDFEPEDLRITLSQAIEYQALVKRRDQQDFELRHQSDPARELIGNSPAMTRLRESIAKVRDSSATVLILGESGTGKERIAKSLRRTLPDGSLEPFVAVDCATLQRTMAESLLFGHEKGAFSGADRAHRGYFEEANGGTLFLDEVGNLSLEIQAKLLRAVQEKEIRRLGSTRPIRLDVRILSATNEPLEKTVEAGRFKLDLYQRLNVIQLESPPLRDRSEDVEPLMKHFAPGLEISAEAGKSLRRYSWPGNVRELESLARWLETFAPDQVIRQEDLPPKLLQRLTESETFYARVESFEREILKSAYSRHDGNVSRMAESLGMDRSHLHHKLKQLGIQKPNSKNSVV